MSYIRKGFQIQDIIITKGSKYHTQEGRAAQGTTSGQYNSNHKTTRGVTTKWEGNPFTHKTKEPNFYLSLKVYNP